MSLLAPIYLLLLVPWAGLVVWLLRRRGRDVAVPFVRLWQQPDASDAVAHRRRLPPPHLLLVLAALLIAILAAARPAVRDPVASGPPITLIIDTGLTMSAASDKGTIASAL